MKISLLHINSRKRSNLSGWKLFPLVSLFCMPAFTGCSQYADNFFPEVPETNQPGGNVNSNEPVIIGVSVDAVDDYFGGVVTRTGKTIEKIVQPLDSTRDTGYNIETIIESIPLENPIQTRGTLSNIHFRVVAYKGSNIVSSDNYAGTAVFQTDGSGIATIVKNTAEPAGSTGLWTLSPGTYSFVCYSMGTDVNPDELVDNKLNIPHNEDFMIYQKLNVSVTAGSNGIFMLNKISFKRQCAKFQIAFKSEVSPDNNEVSACAATVTNTNFNPCTWEASQEEIDDTGTGGLLDIEWENLGTETVTSKSYYVLPMNSRTIGITFNSLTIDGTSYANTVTVSPTDREFAAKGNYKISITIKPDKIIWASGNLVKSDIDNSYSFAERTEHGSYFGWNTLDDSFGAHNSGEYSKANDPCTKVFPAGTWVTPTKAQLQELIDSGSIWTGTGRQFGGKYSDVFLPAAGFRGYDGKMYNVGTHANYWSSTLNDTNAYFLDFSTSHEFIDNNFLDDSRSVRCVKE